VIPEKLLKKGKA